MSLRSLPEITEALLRMRAEAVVMVDSLNLAGGSLVDRRDWAQNPAVAVLIHVQSRHIRDIDDALRKLGVSPGAPSS